MVELNLTIREQELIASFDDAARSWPLVRDNRGTLRFQATRENRTGLITEWYEKWCCNEITTNEFREFYRSIGYSVGGYAELIDGGSL